MAYVEGRSLAERLAQEERFEDIGEAVTLIRQVLDALDAIHARGIIHRDLKPSNILLDPAGRAVLTDFGLARPEHDAEQLTSDGVVVGTPSYMAPEQAAGQSGQIGPWTDLYSLGVVLYQMVTSRLPFEGPPLFVLSQILHERPTDPSRWRSGLPPILETILLKALSKEVSQRYDSAQAFAGDLEGVCRATGSPATQPAEIAKVRETGSPLPEPATARQLPAQAPPTAPSLLTEVLAPAGILWGVCLILLLIMGSIGGGSELSWSQRIIILITIVVLLFGTLWIFVSDPEKKKQRRKSSLLAKVMQGDTQGVKHLLDKGINLEAKDDLGETALMKAVESGHSPIVKLLLLRGAAVHEKNRFGQSALMIAQAKGHTDIAELLRQAGATE